MFGIGWAEILVIIMVAVIVLGPEKLPEAAKVCGRLYGQLKRTMTEATNTIRTEADMLNLDAKDAEASTEDSALDNKPENEKIPSTPSGSQIDESTK